MLRCIALLILLLPTMAAAHSFAQPYQLPMPYWMYIYAALAALVLSFLIVGYFAGARQRDGQPVFLPIGDSRWVRLLRTLRLMTLIRLLSVAALLLCIVSGLIGSRDPYRNFNMTFFWLLFCLGFSYATALLGNWYAVVSPWVVISRGIGRIWSGFLQGRIRYPQGLAYWPALAFYMAFIWIELLGNTRPFSLSVILLVYTGINLFGVWLVGATHWFRYCEFFAVFMRLLAKMAPLQYHREVTGAQCLKLRWPFVGLLDEEAEHFSMLVFILFMLSSTAFDGLRETALWFSLFWKDPTGLFTWIIGEHPIYTYGWIRPWYFAYETLWMLASPFLYLSVYWVFLWLGKLLTRSQHSVYELALRYAYSLLPIVLVYHITHYYTLLLSQGAKIRALISDPFGWNWDIFGTAYSMRQPVLLDPGFIWNSQVLLILLGHVASVYLAHKEALRICSTRRQATLSQLPMLFLMVLFTSAGLWILAQPLQGR